MTDRPDQWWREVAASFPCDTCGARPGAPCQTKGGVRKYEMHVDRSRRASAVGWAVARQPAPDVVPRCLTCGVVLPKGTPPGAECGRCTRVRELAAEALAPSPRKGNT